MLNTVKSFLLVLTKTTILRKLQQVFYVHVTM